MTRYLNNWFNFYPVGQGLFYAGILANGYSFVFDCGTETGGCNIENYIKHLRSYTVSRKLNLLTISHFHNDHISGVEKLLNYFDVEELIIPYICSDFTIRIAIAASIMCYSLQDEEIITIINYLLRRETGHNWEQENNSYHIIIREGFWRFDFITKAISDSEYQLFKNQFEKILNDTGCLNTIQLLQNGHKDKLKDIYEAVFGKGNMLNETSVVMLHRPIITPLSDCVVRSISCQVNWPSFIKYVSPVSLLTGDALFDSGIASRINSLINTDVGIIQAPHHGSYKNWNSLYTSIKNGNSIYLIPCGTHNRFRHPSKQTISDLNGHEYYKVTEFSGFPYWITFF